MKKPGLPPTGRYPKCIKINEYAHSKQTRLDYLKNNKKGRSPDYQKRKEYADLKDYY